MKLFFAGAEQKYWMNVAVEAGVKHALGTFDEYKKKKDYDMQKYFEEAGFKGEFFLDSGAFAGFTQGVEINIDDYIYFIKKNKHVLTYYASLDSIGDAEKTLKNMNYIESQGLNPIPTFHYGEDWKYLHYYCSKYDYIALGGMVPISTPNLRKWLDAIFSKYPNQKFHGFGLTNFELMQRYPWFSVDSTSWLMGSKFATVMTPFGNFNMSYKMGTQKGNHIENASESIRVRMKQYIKDKGFTWEQITADDGHRARAKINICYFQEIEKTKQIKNFTIRQNQLGDFCEVEPMAMHKETMKETYDEWIKENYGDVDESIKKKLIQHQFGEQNANF